MTKRRRGREEALKLIFQVDVGGLPLQEVRSIFLTNHSLSLSEETTDFALRLVKGTCANLEQIDELIEKFAVDWRLERMVSTDRNVLRLAIYEILYMDDVPVSVSINEAVELAKKYGTEESSKFVNGILGNLVRSFGSKPVDLEGEKPCM